MASLPIWLEGILNRKYPKWRDVEHNDDGSARYMPAGVRAGRRRRCCARYPRRRHRLPAIRTTCDKFIGPRTRVVAVSTHNPLGVTFAAGVYTSIFGSSKKPINSHYARELFAAHQGESVPRRSSRSSSAARAAGRSSQTELLRRARASIASSRAAANRPRRSTLFDKAIRGEELPRQIDVAHPKERDAILLPDKRTTFGVVEMTTGCGRRCKFCVPDLNPQIDLPKDKIMARRARQRPRRQQADLAGDRGHVHLGPGAHRHAVLFPEPRSAARSVQRHRRTRPASSSTC